MEIVDIIIEEVNEHMDRVYMQMEAGFMDWAFEMHHLNMAFKEFREEVVKGKCSSRWERLPYQEFAVGALVHQIKGYGEDTEINAYSRLLRGDDFIFNDLINVATTSAFEDIPLIMRERYWDAALEHFRNHMRNYLEKCVHVAKMARF